MPIMNIILKKLIFNLLWIKLLKLKMYYDVYLRREKERERERERNIIVIIVCKFYFSMDLLWFISYNIYHELF